MCIETFRTVLIFSKMTNLRGHMPRFSLKNECFPTYVPGNTINVCWNPQNSARFSKMIILNGHRPRFTLKMNGFQSISWETHINVYWNFQNSAHFFQDDQFEGSHAWVYSKNEHFPTYVLGKHHKCVLKSSEQGLFFQRWSIWGVTCLGLL